ncbi:hypothetical protein QA635_17490 [Bradyrhizobium brasilense]|uniref:hypothetical protein n=1 Tax=Bradyrhizobium brasilense TaxID=1419277 RepID=UPI0024B17FC1|nr:hypothetical protein [Bradyrhizobium australafricanum]WFU36105.1 hypothetical protein QA635_17490 [Bradyrhizobium australafricanum]
MEIANCNRIADDNRIADNRARDHDASNLLHGDDAAHCSNGLNAQNFRNAAPDDRVIYRRWIRGAIMVYGLLAFAAGAVVWINGTGIGQTQLTSLSNPSSMRPGHGD